ncbi:MAG: addiction module antidote protein [Candidatus Omnitrophota bacterium]
MKPAVSYRDALLRSLKDPEEAAEYLSASLEAGDPKAFLLALRNVIEACGGMTHIAQASGVHRVSLYKMLSGRGNPGLGNIMRVLQKAGLHFETVAGKGKKRAFKNKRSL